MGNYRLFNLGVMIGFLIPGLPVGPFIAAQVGSESSMPVPATTETPGMEVLRQFTADSHVLGFRPGEMYIAAADHMLRVEFAGARDVAPQAKTAPGNDTQVTPLDTVTYSNLWDGVTLIYRKSEDAIAKSSYLIAPESVQAKTQNLPPARSREPKSKIDQIRLRYNVPVHLDTTGNLILEFDSGQMRESAPVAWQDIDGQRVPVPVRYVLLNPEGQPAQNADSPPGPPQGGEKQFPSSETHRPDVPNVLVGFAVGAYDPAYPLVIDPALTWHTFLGSGSNDRGNAIAMDGAGNVYVAGFSSATWGSNPKRAYSGDNDAYVAKLNSNGELIWHTFLGSSDTDWGDAIAVDVAGDVYVAGYSSATWGSNPKRAYSGGNDAFIAKLNNSGELLWHTFLGSGGDDFGQAITVDGAGNVYVTGFSSATWGSNPKRAYSGDNDVFVAKLNSSGDTIMWHTFLGSSDTDYGRAIAVDGAGNVYVAGASFATWDTPRLPFSGAQDALVAKLNSNGDYEWHTFLGSGPSDYGNAITVDGAGNVYVAGYSNATWGMPVTPFHGFTADAFAARLNSNGILSWNTFLGSNSSDLGNAIAVDGAGNVYVAGYSNATWGTPVIPFAGIPDAFVAKLNSSVELTWNTFLGSGGFDSAEAIAVDGVGQVYAAGYSLTTWGMPLDPYAGSQDAFVAKISPPRVIDLVPLPNTHTVPLTIAVAATYDQAISPTPVGRHMLAVHAMQTGLLSQTFDMNSATVQLTPIQPFKPGELVQVSATSATLSLYNDNSIPRIWQFRAGVTVGTGVFSDTGQSLGGSSTHAVALGDLDHDGQLDAFVANAGNLQPPGQGNKIWRNDAGTFVDTGQGLGTKVSTAVALGDVDGDGDLDAFVVNWAGQADEIWLNGESGNPPGTFSFGQSLADINWGYDVALGDLDGDGDLDAFVANWNGQPNEVWLNNGAGTFSHSGDSGHNLGNLDSLAVALGDVDGDGDLDAFVGNEAQPNRVWRNDGAGHFSLGQTLPNPNSSWAIALGDLDGDGGLDAFVGNGSNLGQPNQVWTNDGQGTFSDSGQSLGNDNSRDLSLGDVSGDGDLDVFEVNFEGSRVWYNDGRGNFNSGPYLSDTYSRAVDLGDLDGDGDLDAFMGNGFNQFNQMWLNQLTESGGGGGGGAPPKVYLPSILKPDNTFTEFVIRNINAGDGLSVTIEDPGGVHNPLICLNIANNSAKTCGKFPSIGTYRVTANAQCGQFIKIFHDAFGGTVTRSVFCN